MVNNVNPKFRLEMPPPLPPELDDPEQAPSFFTHSALSKHPEHLSQISGAVPAKNPAQMAFITLLVDMLPRRATPFTKIVGRNITLLSTCAFSSISKRVLSLLPIVPPESLMQLSIKLMSTLALLKTSFIQSRLAKDSGVSHISRNSLMYAQYSAPIPSSLPYRSHIQIRRRLSLTTSAPDMPSFKSSSGSTAQYLPLFVHKVEHTFTPLLDKQLAATPS
mmetsp:Transcript_16835/g.19995  ORF Transcript_16835/g.19995 Transcript_16835/m.19995 type:complete len:220 (+) Transcript_16835:230-889(+)